MRTQTERVLQTLFSENSLDNISIDQLRRIVDEHPYFTLGHLLLAKKLQATNGDEFEMQSKKVSLYFNEPIWLQTLLYPPGEAELRISERRLEEGLPQEASLDQHPIVEDQVVQETTINDPSPDLVVVEESIESIEEPVQVIEEQVPVDEQPLAFEEHAGNEAHETESSHKLSEVIVEEGKEELQKLFEPYHTIDYFASQGIKVSTEIKADDRLAQQLRSFTEWLKTMKRLPESHVEVQLDEVAQQNIQEFAAHSLDEKEIITESMAEVLVKQSRESEAITMYEKLSLLNPSKRAYFAAKIEQLKGL